MPCWRQVAEPVFVLASISTRLQTRVLRPGIQLLLQATEVARRHAEVCLDRMGPASNWTTLARIQLAGGLEEADALVRSTSRYDYVHVEIFM